jgi:diguanylate cyclase (GGDEF)-like protein
MPETELAAARTAAEKLRLTIADHRFNKIDKLTVSFGVAAFEPKDDPNSLLKRVDDALYQAKQQGRNRVEVLAGNPVSSGNEGNPH